MSKSKVEMMIWVFFQLNYVGERVIIMFVVEKVSVKVNIY